MTSFNDGGTIVLQNPVADQFELFIFGNATKCDQVVERNSAKGQHLIICGAGPSLAEHAKDWCHKGDQVWGCNSALTWLADNGYKVTHGFTVDQTPHMLEEWASTPDVEYLLATTVHDHLTDLLISRDRKLRFFHNYVGCYPKCPTCDALGGVKDTEDGETRPCPLCGGSKKDPRPVSYGVCKECQEVNAPDASNCKVCNGPVVGMVMGYEDWLYCSLYPATIRAGSGLNAVTRAIDVAEFMGFRRITVLGADCALRVTKPRPKDAAPGSPEHTAWLKENVVMHADGSHALSSGATPVTMEGEIDGRLWTTKPDMMITAVWMVKMRRRIGAKLEIIGDTLPNALKFKPESFLKRLPSLVDSRGDLLPTGRR